MKIETREDWIRAFMTGTNDLDVTNSAVSRTPLVNTIAIMTAAAHNDPDFAAIIARSLFEKVQRVHNFSNIEKQERFVLLQELVEKAHLVEESRVA